jgi:hypothetical protein
VIELTCPRWRRAQHDGRRVHESLAFDDVDVTIRDGIPVTTVGSEALRPGWSSRSRNARPRDRSGQAGIA